MEDIKILNNLNNISWFRFNSIKALGIIQVGILYFILQIITTNLIKKIFDTNDDNINYDNKPLWKLTFEVLLQTIVIILANWIIFKFVGKIPFIFDGVDGIVYNKLKERNGTILGAFILILFMGKFKDKLIYLVDRYKKLLHI